jgi:4-amino-4-deoxy-L-arabinose transferase-like glycosyltransferase
MFEAFEAYHLPPLFIALPLFIISIVLFQYKKNWGIISLVLATLVLGYFMANLDPFLNTWDEQQHALVAKNMMNNPFKPMLYVDPLFDYDPEYWVENHIWLHKQPLFLWQMAASMKVFGANVIAVRLPSIIMHAILPYLIYRIGKIVANPRAGFIAAFIFALLHFPLELVAGRFATDHNDIAFLFYSTWAIMCLLEYHKSKEKKWLYLLGLAAGCAVLVKWLMGLFVFGLAYIIQLTNSQFKFWKIKDFLYLLIPLSISVLVFLPWQLYIFSQFPIEAGIEFKAAASHFNEVLEGHTGDWTYHFTKGIEELYGIWGWVPYFLAACIIIGIWWIEELKYKLAWVVGLLFVYIFFSIAATKMPGFALIVMPIVLICIGVTFDGAFIYLEKHLKAFSKWILLVLTCTLGFLFLNISKIGENHGPGITWYNASRQAELDELNTIIDLREKYQGEEKVVIFNANTTVVGHIQYMFFTEFTAYSYIPDEQQIETAIQLGYQIIVIDRGNLNDLITSDDRIIIHDLES